MLKSGKIKTKVLPKYCMIKEVIKQDILGGKYNNDEKRLPSCRDFVEIFDASYVTVNKALNLLQDEGYAKMIQGKGIFATRPRRMKSADKADKAGFIMSTQGDLYQNIFTVMFRKLEAEDILSVPACSTAQIDRLLQWEKDEKFEKLASQDFKTVVINGNRHFPYTVLQRYCSRLNQVIFVIHFESCLNFPEANFILTDFSKGGYLAADCLLKNGRKKIALITFEKLSKSFMMQNGSREKNSGNYIVDGAKKAFEENRRDFKNNFSVIYDDLDYSGNSNVVHELKKFFASGGDGVICLGDNRALPLYKYAAENNIKIGKDIGVVGYYNTSWTEVYSPPLTSISVQENKIGELAVKAVLNGWRGKKMEVEPKLIKRGSE